MISSGSRTRMQWFRIFSEQSSPVIFLTTFYRAIRNCIRNIGDPSLKNEVFLFGETRTNRLNFGWSRSWTRPFDPDESIQYVLQKWTCFIFEWPIESHLKICWFYCFKKRFFIFNNFRKWHLCIGRHRNRYSSQSVILNHL